MWLESLFSAEMTGNLFGFTVQNLLYSGWAEKTHTKKQKTLTKHLKGYFEIICKLKKHSLT